MDRRAVRSLDTELKSRCRIYLLSPLHPPVLSNCNPVQFLAIAIREASVISVSETTNSFNIVQFSEMEIILASVI